MSPPTTSATPRKPLRDRTGKAALWLLTAVSHGQSASSGDPTASANMRASGDGDLNRLRMKERVRKHVFLACRTTSRRQLSLVVDRDAGEPWASSCPPLDGAHC